MRAPVDMFASRGWFAKVIWRNGRVKTEKMIQEMIEPE